MNRLFQRVYHLWERIVREGKALPMRWRVFGPKVAWVTFWDGLIPPGKSPRYVRTIENAVDKILQPVLEAYRDQADVSVPDTGKIPVWCCWWQGVEQMPELVRMCHERLKQVIPEDRAELHIITLDNYRQYADIPEHIIDKFERKIITMTTMSDVLRFALLSKHGGYWLDATVFFTGDIPEQFFSGEFFTRRKAADPEKVQREACRGNWCGFSMAGPKDCIVFRYMSDAFSYWYQHYDIIIDYVLIDYMLYSGFKHVPAIHSIISQVPDGPGSIFGMYSNLNLPYSPELMERFAQDTPMHKLTYKMDLRKETPEGQKTLYGYLLEQTYGK